MEYSKLFIRFNWLTLVLIYLVIFAGSFVRISGSGMGCPDWPKCFGKWVPPTEISELPANYREAYLTIDVYRTDFVQQVVVDVDYQTHQTWIYNLHGQSFSNTAQAEFGWEIRKRLDVKTAYRYVDTRVTYKTGLLQKALVSNHRAFINLAYETKNKHWQFDATLQYNGKKRLPQSNSNPTEYQRSEYSPEFFNILGQISYLTKI
jgi:hypothetical protein